MQTLSSFGLNKHEDFEFSSLIQIPPEPFKMYKWKILKSFIPQMEVQLTEHCNLNCAHCLNNCPVAEPNFLNIEQFELDFAKLSKLTSERIGVISLTGGEPLLNPDIIKIMQIARRNFPNTEIRIITNGILLTKMKEDFWVACKNNEIPITISQYPIKLDLDKISQVAEKYAADVFWNTTIEVDNVRTFAVKKYDMAGKQDIQESYKKCYLKKCTFIQNGKIYLCQQIYNSKILEKAFDVNFSISNEDFLDLNRIKNIQEILDFISHPSPFCRYCYMSCKGVPWKISEKKKEEWIL
jgi:MoaA/NifB/PqqE/SkfB family radical SAM enzyme